MTHFAGRARAPQYGHRWMVAVLGWLAAFWELLDDTDDRWADDRDSRVGDQ